jgi:L-lactate utilization protein LutC
MDDLIEELESIGTDLMESVGETFPPTYFPELDEILKTQKKDGVPYGDDLMFATCVINAMKIENLIIKLKAVKKKPPTIGDLIWQCPTW